MGGGHGKYLETHNQLTKRLYLKQDGKGRTHSCFLLPHICHGLWLLPHMGNQAYTYTCWMHTHTDTYAHCTSKCIKGYFRLCIFLRQHASPALLSLCLLLRNMN